MTQYINKSALVAEVERRIDFFTEESKKGNSDINIAIALCGFENFLDTLEVKEVQEEYVNEDLEEAATKYARKQVANPDYPTYNDEYEMVCAFEAGAQWQKEQLMDKACEWLKCQDEMVDISFTEDFIIRFKDYIKGE